MRPKSKHINLVLSGTGALYPAQVGAICALMDLGYSFKALSGTSGGAIMAAAVATGITKDRLRRIIIDYNPWSLLFKKPDPFFSPGWGIYDNYPLEMIINHMTRKEQTFESCPIPLHIVATQLAPSYNRVVFNKHSSPDMSLSTACRISSAIPILFKAIKYKGATLIDGTFVDNLHLEPFKSDFDHTIAITVKIRSIGNPQTFWQYVKSCLSMLITDQSLPPFLPDNLTLIPIDVYDYIVPLKFNLSRGDKIKLYDIGYNTVMIHLNQKH